MADESWLWEEPMGIPEAEDIGPPLSEQDIAHWEARYGRSLPAILKRAYQQQDGGYIRGSFREVSLVRLHDLVPVDEGYFDGLTWNDDDLPLDPAQVFYLGSDATGAAVLLHYGQPKGSEPAVYYYYSDGGALELLANTAAELFEETNR